MDRVVHLGNLKNLESLTLYMTVVREVKAKPPFALPSWVVRSPRGGRGDGLGTHPGRCRGRRRPAVKTAESLRSEALDLLGEAEDLIQQAKALLKEAASLSE